VQIDPLIKDVLVPVASPLVAAIAIVFAVRTESKKLRLAKLQEQRERVDSVFTDALYCSDLFKLLVYQFKHNGSVGLEHLADFQKSIERIFQKIFSSPEAGHQLYDQVRFLRTQNNSFLILAELRFRVSGMKTGQIPDIFIPFGLHTLLYLYDSNAARRNQYYEVLEEIRRGDPGLYDSLLVDRNTKSLNSSSSKTQWRSRGQ
jgi:hypothetical protein